MAGHQVTLPGIGSYTWLASQQANKTAIFYVLITIFVVIALYDQIIFRPLVAWAEKFKAEQTGSEIVPQSWVLDLFREPNGSQFWEIYFQGFLIQL